MRLQLFGLGVCDRVSANLLNSPVSGLLGLGWESIASSKAKPFWQTLVSNGAWDQPVMAFQLTRYIWFDFTSTDSVLTCCARFINDTSADVLAPGGTFTMGAVNSSLYTGEIDYVNIPSGKESYWLIPVESELKHISPRISSLTPRVICSFDCPGQHRFYSYGG